MKYAKFSDDFLSYFRLDDNGETLVLTDKQGCTRAVKLLPYEERPKSEWIYHDKLNAYFCKDCGLLVPFTKEEVEDGVRLPNFCHYCGAEMRKPNCVRCDHFGNCDGCERGKKNE